MADRRRWGLWQLPEDFLEYIKKTDRAEIRAYLDTFLTYSKSKRSVTLNGFESHDILTYSYIMRCTPEFAKELIYKGAILFLCFKTIRNTIDITKREIEWLEGRLENDRDNEEIQRRLRTEKEILE